MHKYIADNQVEVLDEKIKIPCQGSNDISTKNDNGDQVFMLAQSYMPAQDIHILKNLNNEKILTFIAELWEDIGNKIRYILVCDALTIGFADYSPTGEFT